MRTRSLAQNLFVLLVFAGVLLFVGANAHLLYLALDSTPECVTHLKTGDAEPGKFSAAKSDC